MKKIITILAVVMLVGTFASASFAKETQNKTNSSSSIAEETQSKTKETVQDRIKSLEEKQQAIANKKAEMDAKRAQFKTKREEFSAYKEALKVKRLAMIENRKANMTLRQDNNKLRVDLLNSINAIKESGATISAETQAKLDEYNVQIKEILAGIKETKGDIQDVLKTNKESIKTKDYIAMDAAFEQVYTIQQFRNAELTKINVILQDMVKLLATEV